MLALQEVRRSPRRFAVAAGVLVVIATLLLLNSALLDGLFLGNTGALRRVDADVVVYEHDARQSTLRSRLTADDLAAIRAVDGVESVGGLGVSLVGVAIPDRDDLADGAVVGYELAGDDLPAPPAPGEAYADRRLEDDGVAVGQTVLVGPAQVPLEVVGWVDDASYQLQGSLWVEPSTWREVQDRSRPDAPVGEGAFQVAVVHAADGVEPGELADRIDAATADGGGTPTESLLAGQAQLAVPGVAQQNDVFSAIIVTTYGVSALVVALFFVVVTIERIPLYGTLKAIGASTGRLLAGLVVQAVVLAAASFLVAWGLVLLLTLVVPDDLPFQLVPARAVFLLVGVVAVSAIGASISFRRIARVDPASAVGRTAV
jgi:putative ABC transport system permease protein